MSTHVELALPASFRDDPVPGLDGGDPRARLQAAAPVRAGHALPGENPLAGSAEGAGALEISRADEVESMLDCEPLIGRISPAVR